MLDPNARCLYTTALAPPPGLVLDVGVATTFSLDPTTLLTVPMHLTFSSFGRDAALRDPVALLQALGQTTRRLTVYAQRGRLQPPTAKPSELYGLLESMVVEVTAPGGGVFHPKLWVLRYVDPDDESDVALRLLVLSRNLTADRSWDLSLQLEGKPTGAYVKENRALGRLVSALPELAVAPVERERAEATLALADEVRRTRWEVPPGFESVRFHDFGVGKDGSWPLEPSDSLAVVSPFCSVEVLAELCAASRRPVALVSRPETLQALGPEARSRFERCLVLDEAAETDDGEDLGEAAPAAAHDTCGLHAKALVLQRGWRTHLFVGSANATNSGLRTGRNVEVLAELVGLRSHVGLPADFVEGRGLGELLVEFSPADLPEVDQAEARARQAVEAARDALAAADLTLRCAPAGEGLYEVVLASAEPIALDGLASLRAWPISVAEDKAADAMGLASGAPVLLGRLAPATVTRFVAFAAEAADKAISSRFVLLLEAEGLPADREAHIMRRIIRDRDGLLRYLLLLLGEEAEPARVEDLVADGGQASPWSWSLGLGGQPLLEEMTRVFARRPERLIEVGRVIENLCRLEDCDEVLPPELLELWKIFAKALELQGGPR